MDKVIEKCYCELATFLSGPVIQMRFRWLEAVFTGFWSTLMQYICRPLLMIKYCTALARPVLPSCHINFLPYYVNRIFFSPKPTLLVPTDVCPGNCGKKCCKHLEKKIIVGVNGTGMIEEFNRDAQICMSDMFSLPVYFFSIETSSIWIDIWNCFFQKFSHTPSYHAEVLFCEMIKFTNIHDLDEVILVGHGNGGKVICDFLDILREKNFPPEFINKFRFILVGSNVCKSKWTRDECGKLISCTGDALCEKSDAFGNLKPHRSYSKSKYYNNDCNDDKCDIDHSKCVPFPYFEHIWNSNDLVARCGVANTSRVVSCDMQDMEGCKIEICDRYGHLNYLFVDDDNAKAYSKSLLAPYYNCEYKNDKTVKKNHH